MAVDILQNSTESDETRVNETIRVTSRLNYGNTKLKKEVARKNKREEFVCSKYRPGHAALTISKSLQIVVIYQLSFGK